MPFLNFQLYQKQWHVYIFTKQNETMAYILQYTLDWVSCTINLLILKCFGPEEKCLSLGFQTFQCNFESLPTGVYCVWGGW